MASMLLHTCCAHCAAFTVEYWRGQGWEVSAFWYNPNIHPIVEHQCRLGAMQQLARETDLPLIIYPDYQIIDFFRLLAGHEGERCGDCFRLRLSRTAEAGRENGLAAFSTTLLISPHQQHELLRKVGQAVGREQGVEFLYADLRRRYSASRRITKPLDLYRQQYCGCLYSEWERYSEGENSDEKKKP